MGAKRCPAVAWGYLCLGELLGLLHFVRCCVVQCCVMQCSAALCCIRLRPALDLKERQSHMYRDRAREVLGDPMCGGCVSTLCADRLCTRTATSLWQGSPCNLRASRCRRQTRKDTAKRCPGRTALAPRLWGMWALCPSSSMAITNTVLDPTSATSAIVTVVKAPRREMPLQLRSVSLPGSARGTGLERHFQASGWADRGSASSGLRPLSAGGATCPPERPRPHRRSPHSRPGERPDRRTAPDHRLALHLEGHVGRALSPNLASGGHSSRPRAEADEATVATESAANGIRRRHDPRPALLSRRLVVVHQYLLGGVQRPRPESPQLLLLKRTRSPQTAG